MLLIGLVFVLINFLYKVQKKDVASWSVVRVTGYVLTAVSCMFFAFINADWFTSFEGYVCAVAVSWTVPIIEEWLLLSIWKFVRHYYVSV